MILSEFVPYTVALQRRETCDQCEYKVRRKKYFFFGPLRIYCGICGCGVDQANRIVHLTLHKENLPHWGCKHPKRKEGHGWVR